MITFQELMKRHVLMYGLIGGIPIAMLKWTEYQFLIVEHSIEIYGELIVGLVTTLISAVVLKEKPQSQPERSPLPAS